MAITPPGLAQRLPFYYGWLIVGAQFMAVMATAGPTTWAFGVFAVPMEEELGWGRGTLFGAVTVRMIIGVGLMPFMSRLMDKPRWPALVMVSTSVAYAVSLMLVATVQTVTQYYLVLGVLGGLSAAGASGGGAVYNNGEAADAVFTNCTFRHNTASGGGGAMLNNAADPVLWDCHFVENRSTAGAGGALFGSGAVVLTLDGHVQPRGGRGRGDLQSERQHAVDHERRLHGQPFRSERGRDLHVLEYAGAA